jgi:hypothetical protein
MRFKFVDGCTVLLRMTGLRLMEENPELHTLD